MVSIGILLFCLLLMLAVVMLYLYCPKRINIKITKHPDGTYRLKYSWGWHDYDDSFSEHHQTIDGLKNRLAEILDKTEWKKE